MPDRIPCANPDCARTILPITGEQTGGYCMVCVREQAIEEEREEQRLEQERREREGREVDPYEGVMDPVEVLKIYHRPKPHDPLITWLPRPDSVEVLYGRLSPQGAQELADHMEQVIRTGQPEDVAVMDVFPLLAGFTEANLGGALQAMLHSTKRDWQRLPPFVFSRANAAVRDELMEALQAASADEDTLLLNDRLIALAWTGDGAVVELFKAWREQPPAWKDKLYLEPHRYAKEAGWELSAEGQRRDLYYQTCRGLAQGHSNDPAQFMAGGRSKETCPWCARPLLHLFELEPAAFGLPRLSETATRIQVTTCGTCMIFGYVFGKLDEQGRGSWHPANERPDYLPNAEPGNEGEWHEIPEDCLNPAQKRLPLRAAYYDMPEPFTQLGGHPSWLQDAEYPECPDCKRLMPNLGQLSLEDQGDEGIFFAHICVDCGTTATLYQQT